MNIFYRLKCALYMLKSIELELRGRQKNYYHKIDKNGRCKMEWDAFYLCFGKLDFHIKVGNLDKFKESIRKITSENQNIKFTYN